MDKYRSVVTLGVTWATIPDRAFKCRLSERSNRKE